MLRRTPRGDTKSPVNATGNAIPPIVFPHVRFKEQFMNGSTAGSVGHSTRSGWVNEEAFKEHFIRQTNCSTNHPVLLILDNQESHISLKAVTTAKENGVVMLTLPPHTSYRLQPLDKTVYYSMKTCYNSAMDGLMRTNPGRTVMIYEVPELVNQTFMSAITPRNITSGFIVMGIYPFNRDIFPDEDYAPSMLTGQTQKSPPPVLVLTCLDHHMRSQPKPQVLKQVQTQGSHPFFRNQMRRKKVKSKIVTDTPEKMELEKAQKENG
ncbi:hypothetical protein AOLI_G00005900 [Acnodon oligacanthus]